MAPQKQQGRGPSHNSRELTLMESQQRILQEIEIIKEEIVN
jgi:hypothetical protein